MTAEVVHLDEVGFAPGGARLAPLLEAENTRVLLLSLQAGQAVDPCRMVRNVLYLVLEGRGRIQVEDQDIELTANTLLTVPKEALRCIQAETQLRVLAVQVP
jgi:mannose-6-phosphate isomerase-like protein (cupin superfamily)